MRNYIAACLLACGIFVAAAVSIPLSANAADAMVPKHVTDGVWVTAVNEPLKSEPPSIVDYMNSEPEPVVEMVEEPVPGEPYYGPYNESLNNNPAYINGGHSYGNNFESDGVAYIGEQEFNWYSQNVMPGGGLDELNANGRHVNESTGFIVDGEGYIAVASPWGRDEIGTVIETPFGQGKIYDANEGSAYDIYTDF